MENKTTVRYLYTSTRMSKIEKIQSAGEYAEQLELSYIASVSAK